MSGLNITITNYTTLQWNRIEWIAADGESKSIGKADEINNTPSLIIPPMGGQTTAAAEQFTMESITQDALYIQVKYQSGNDIFGIYVTQNFQEFSIGKGDQWSYYQNGEWSANTQDTTPITWNFSDCIVVATPTLHHQSASVLVSISTLTSLK